MRDVEGSATTSRRPDALRVASGLALAHWNARVSGGSPPAGPAGAAVGSSVSGGSSASAVLIHGRADTWRSLRGVATSLRDRGLDVWAYDRRGYGDSVDSDYVADPELSARHVAERGASIPGEPPGSGSGPCPGGRFDEDVEDLALVASLAAADSGRDGDRGGGQGGDRGERRREDRGDVDVLVGHSLGGFIALGVGARSPHSARAIVAYEPPYPWSPYWPQEITDRQKALLLTHPDDELLLALGVAERDLHRHRGVLDDLTSFYWHAPMLPLDALDVPVLFVSGSETTRYFTNTAQWLARQVPSGSWAQIDGAAHDAHITHHDQLARLAVEFMESL